MHRRRVLIGRQNGVDNMPGRKGCPENYHMGPKYTMWVVLSTSHRNATHWRAISLTVYMYNRYLVNSPVVLMIHYD